MTKCDLCKFPSENTHVLLLSRFICLSGHHTNHHLKDKWFLFYHPYVGVYAAVLYTGSSTEEAGSGIVTLVTFSTAAFLFKGEISFLPNELTQ